MIPSYADIFMRVLENNDLESQEKLSLLYRRYIDDIFTTWNHDFTGFLQFNDRFNGFHTTITFTSSHSVTDINFLDVQVDVKDES